MTAPRRDAGDQSRAEVDLSAGPAYRLPFWPADADAHSTEARIRVIGFDSPEIADWVRGLCERLDARGQRDSAVRAAAAMMACSAPSAKALDAELARYLVGFWNRGDRERDAAAPEWSELRKQLFRIARLTNSAGLGWRQILRLIDL